MPRGEVPSSSGHALLVGVASTLWHLPPLLRRAELHVDSITVRSPYFRLPGSRRGAQQVATLTEALREAATRMAKQRYALVVASDDSALRLLRDWSGLPFDQRLALAPVLGANDLEHLASKTTMTARLEAAGVPVPQWLEAHDVASAQTAADALGWPVVLKNDYGAGGRGVRVVANREQLNSAWTQLQRAHSHAEGELPTAVQRPMRVLVQQFVGGYDVDLSAFFQSGRLVHFTYARFTGTLTTRGASVMRHYWPTALNDPAIVNELTKVGAALGLDGFTNITVREQPDSRGRMYFEVDARPNLWTHFGAHLGDDPVVRLRRWFAYGEIDLGPTYAAGALDPRGRIVRMAHRSKRRDLLRNADGLIGSMPWGTPDSALVLGSALWRGPIVRA